MSSGESLEQFHARISKMRLGDLTDLLITLRLQGPPEGAKAQLLWDRRLAMVREHLNLLGGAPAAEREAAQRPPRSGKVRNLGAFRGLNGR